MNISNSGVFQPKTLEVDESLFDKSLRIIDSGQAGLVNNPNFPVTRGKYFVLRVQFPRYAIYSSIFATIVPFNIKILP